MAKFKQKFERKEIKYLINEEQYLALRRGLAERMRPDSYGESRISNIYYDTPDWRIIRRSLEKPRYKEKLRVRAYGNVNSDSTVFVELKKKFKGVVYKRRVAMGCLEASEYLSGARRPQREGQITREIDYFVKLYDGLAPSMVVAYDRAAFFDKDDSEIRITFDRNICWRTSRLDLTVGSDGKPLIAEGQYLMEVKILGAAPLWLTDLLDKNRIYPTSFSKYGMAYTEMMTGKRLTIPKEYISKDNKILRSEV